MHIKKMSFFRNIRDTITRGKSSSRDTTPVRSTSSGRRDSPEASKDIAYKRSDTIVLPNEQDDNASNTSTLEKISKKSKVLGKFSTFTKRKKTPSPIDSGAYEHHPSDNATNTYYKWTCADNPTNPDYDAHADPFNFLYERQSSLKSLHKSSNSNSATPTRDAVSFDSSTFRKAKMPTQLREHLEQLKTQTHAGALQEEDESGKYKTITLNSYRKSFRDKFLQQQKDAMHNPAWFVEVEPSPMRAAKSAADNAKENHGVLVYANDNYRPHSRSPVREHSNERVARSKTRSPVKRNETFRLETTPLAKPSIRVEIKNSIAPNMPGRIVPVGVAKPMPSSENYHKRRIATTQQLTMANPANASSYSYSKIPAKNWSSAITIAAQKNHNAGQRSGRYQTLVQIGNEANVKPLSTPPSSHHSTRIQLNGITPPVVTTQRYLRAINMAYPPLNTPSRNAIGHEKLSSKPGLKFNSVLQLAKPRQTYFGGDAHFQPSKRPAAVYAQQQLQPSSSSVTLAAPRTFSKIGLIEQRSLFSNKQQQQQQQQLPMYQQRPMQATSMTNNGHLSRSRVPQQQPAAAQRVLVPMQRRSRSPIKMPWR